MSFSVNSSFIASSILPLANAMRDNATPVANSREWRGSD